MTRILFRCDASLLIGSGHVMRCRTLARELQHLGAEVVFLCRRQPGDLIDLLDKDFWVLPLPDQPLIASDGLTDRHLYSAWLGCSQSQDAEDCLTALSNAGINAIDWLVVDHYGLDITWQSRVSNALDANAISRLLVIDDLADRIHQADILLDQNFFSTDTDKRYQDLVPAYCRQLLGPHYALLGPEYAQLRALIPPRTELQRVLVFFGGADPDNLTGLALEALMDPLLSHLAVDVVLGHQTPHRQLVESLAKQRKYTTLHAPLPSLAALIARSDIAIGAGGVTTWERACLKLPSLVVAIASNQMPFAKALADAGHHHLLGETSTVSVNQIRSVLGSWVDEFPPLFDNTYYTDGFGVSRVALAMLGHEGSITLRPANKSDEELLSHWHSDLKLTNNSVGLELTDLSPNSEFDEEFFDDVNYMCFTVTSFNGCPIGQIRLDRSSKALKAGCCEAYFRLFLDVCVCEHALVFEVIHRAFQLMEECLVDKFTRLVCFVRGGSSRESVYSRVAGQESVHLARGCITILSDLGSWLNTYLPELIIALWHRGHAVRWIHDPSQLSSGDVCFLLSCGRLLSPEQLALHRHNLVVHESSLPQGQGWSPMTWQILEGARSIPITLFEATSELDSGQIYLQHQINLTGNELVDEWRALQAQSTLQLCVEWVDRYKEVVAASVPQYGEATYYSRRSKADSQLDPERSLAEQFNLLRVVDNQRYPAFFQWCGKEFIIKVLPGSS